MQFIFDQLNLTKTSKIFKETSGSPDAEKQIPDIEQLFVDKAIALFINSGKADGATLDVPLLWSGYGAIFTPVNNFSGVARLEKCPPGFPNPKQYAYIEVSIWSFLG